MQGSSKPPTRLSGDEIDVAFQVMTGISARSADVQAVQLLGSNTASLAEYVWDHILGEPESIDPGGLAASLERHIDEIRRLADGVEFQGAER